MFLETYIMKKLGMIQFKVYRKKEQHYKSILSSVNLFKLSKES